MQSLSSGETWVEDVPAPRVGQGELRIATTCTLVSAGTERMLVEFGRGNLLQKARQQPDKVRQVVQKARTDGAVATYEAVSAKLDTPIALGYCNVGRVLESKADGFVAGERVVSNGKHAEVVAVPKNLCAKVPENVDDESAAFTVLGAIALQGIRLLQPTLGETVVVTGLGLVGLVAVQLLRAHGCRVLGLDLDSDKLELARRFGAETVDLGGGEDPLAAAARFSRGRGVDAVLLTASTRSNEPIHQAAAMCRKRGRIVLVGVVGMELSRADFYEKEISFQVSCSYGPGRYDPDYEERGNDYPVGFVRWTEQRNFEAVLDMLADGRLDFAPLIMHRFPISEAAGAYDVVRHGNPLGILLTYEKKQPEELLRSSVALADAGRVPGGCAVVGFIGAGNYAAGVLVPAFARTGARLKAIASATGASGVHVGRKSGVEVATTDAEALLSDPEINALVVTTRHDSHARWVTAALNAGKHVFVEKPLALERAQLREIEEQYGQLASKPIVMVGFNRRWAPMVQEMRGLVARLKQPVALSMTVNAGAIDASHWTQDPKVGGGRVIGEVCHFVDLLRFLADSSINSVNAVAMQSQCDDTLSIQLAFADGSIGNINYFANGSRAVAKERLEVFAAGGVLQLDNYRALKAYDWPGAKASRALRMDKGQRQCAAAFVEAVETGNRSALIPFEQIVEVTDACFDIVDQIAGEGAAEQISLQEVAAAGAQS